MDIRNNTIIMVFIQWLALFHPMSCIGLMSDLLSRLSAALAEAYVLDRQIGEGGMATVFLATDLRHDRSVALKVLKPELTAHLGAERFLGEIRTTARLQHPHILPLFDSGEAEGFLFYVMPFVQGASIGTPTYMSPEQAAGDASVDGRSDIYSLACVVYEMLAGEPPYTGPSAASILAKKVTQPPPAVRVVRDTVTPELEAVLVRALARSPADRFSTADDFGRALSGSASATGGASLQVAPIRARTGFRKTTVTAAAGVVDRRDSIGRESRR